MAERCGNDQGKNEVATEIGCHHDTSKRDGLVQVQMVIEGREKYWSFV